jgi:hypothetical protein
VTFETRKPRKITAKGTKRASLIEKPFSRFSFLSRLSRFKLWRYNSHIQHLNTIRFGGFRMDLGLRRLTVWILSIILGAASVPVILTAVTVFTKRAATMDNYGTTYIVLTAIPMALLFALWLDYFLRTGMIPEVDEPAAAPAKKGAAKPTAAAEE